MLLLDNVSSSGAVLELPSAPTSAVTMNSLLPPIYDSISFIVASDGYIPNKRLRELSCLEVSKDLVSYWTLYLEEHIELPTTFRDLAEESESEMTVTADQHHLQLLLSVIQSVAHTKEEVVSSLTLVQKPVQDDCYLSITAGAQPCIYTSLSGSDYTVNAGSTTRSRDASLRTCYPVLVSTCGSAAVHLACSGLSLEAAVVPGIVVAGDSVQFCAVYLILDSFPVLCALSNPLSLCGSADEMHTITTWCVRLASFCMDTIVALLTLQRSNKGAHRRNTARKGQVRLQNGFFVKPVRNMLVSNTPINSSVGSTSNIATKLNKIMQIYKKLYDIFELEELVLFPLGVLSVPTDGVEQTAALRTQLITTMVQDGFVNLCYDHRPVLLFPRLVGFCNSKPPLELREVYLTSVVRAVELLNSCSVAHLDLRPANILWSVVQDTLHVKLIDFEDSVVFGAVIPAAYVELVVATADRRYPFAEGDEKRRISACAVHNNYFAAALACWVNTEETMTFTKYMKEYGDIILNNTTEVC